MTSIRYGSSARRENTIRSTLPLSNDQIARVVPSVFASEAYHSTSDVKLNRALWTLADQLAKYKNGEPSRLAA